jgi:hypothetical protein
MPVVGGTGVGQAQPGQGSYAPSPPALVAGTANRVMVRLCAGPPCPHRVF